MIKIIFFLIPVLLFLILFFPYLLKGNIKGTPFFPTSKNIIRKALKATHLKPGEKLYDLGCGNGRVLIIGAKEFGAKVIGFEYSLLLFYISKINLFINKVKDSVVKKEDFFKLDIKDADVIYLFLTPRALKKLEEKIRREAKIGTRIITFSSPLPSLKPEKIIPLEERKNKLNIYLYVKR